MVFHVVNKYDIDYVLSCPILLTLGVVDAFKDLDCEVVFHPSFMAPEEGFFALQVHGGNTLKLKCTAKVP